MKYAKDFAKVGEDDANIIPVNGFREIGTDLDLSSLSEELLKSSLEVIQTDCSGSPSVSKKNRRSSLLPFQKAIKKEGEDHIMLTDHSDNQVLEHLTNHYQPELDEKYVTDTESKQE